MSAIRWKSQKDGFQEALNYMLGRRDGTITSFKTPWTKMNDATTDGLEWGSLTVIGGRPGTGKTLIKDQIIREGIKKNCTLEEYESARFPFRVLEFQFEMVNKVSAMREFSSVLGKPYKYICSAGVRISDEDMIMCRDYSRIRIKYPIDVVDTPCTVNELKELISEYMEHHATQKEDETVVYKNTVVTLDHSMLIKKDKHERDKFDMLYNFGEAITELKRKYPICFIILSQLNRNVDSPDRNEEGHYGNYILESDIFGADALLQHADTVVGLNRPGLRKIGVYGPLKYIIEDENVLVMHYLKCRNGETGLSFFKAEYDKMRVVEMATPPKLEIAKSPFKKSK
jgi:replicative DNA helicase